MKIQNNIVVLILLLLIMSSIISSCASFYIFNVKSTPAYKRPVKIDNDFDISGRFSIKSLEANRYGNFGWIKNNDTEELSFNTPLGQTVAKVMIDNQKTILQTNDNVYTGDDLDQMMQDKLGFVIPLKYLHYWIQGVALPNTTITQELPSGFSQLGWNVQYLQWQDQNHPRIIQLDNGELVIKLLIDY